MASQRIKAQHGGNPYYVHVFNPETVALTRNGQTTCFTREDLANVFTALLDTLESALQ